jgi:hypothetical protein
VQEICPLRSTWRGLESTGGGQHCGRALPERRQSSTLPTRLVRHGADGQVAIGPVSPCRNRFPVNLEVHN